MKWNQDKPSEIFLWTNGHTDKMTPWALVDGKNTYYFQKIIETMYVINVEANGNQSENIVTEIKEHIRETLNWLFDSKYHSFKTSFKI